MKMNKEKKKKKKEVLLSNDIFIPLTLKDIGSDRDPCFGKIYDLSTNECRRCGDSELCAIATAQNMNVTRKELEKKTPFKDLDSTIDITYVKKHMRKLKRSGNKPSEIIKTTMQKFELSRAEARNIYKSMGD